MIDLSNLSVITSVKVDGPDRLANWRVFLKYFQTFFCNYEIIVVEQGSESQLEGSCTANVVHHFIQSDSPHYKTRNLNMAAGISSRPYLVLCDVDVLLPPQALADGLARLADDAAFVYPYNGVMVAVPKQNEGARTDLTWLCESPAFFDKSYDRQGLVFEKSGFYPIYGDSKYDSTGGALMFRRAELVAAGGWNTNIVSYGFEDMEINERIRKLGFKVVKLDAFNCYHLEHDRHIDSYYNNFYRNNQKEYEFVASMDAAELRAYAAGGFRRDQAGMGESESAKIDLWDLSLVFAVKDLSVGTPSQLNALCELLEESFDGYEIVIVEVAMRKYKYLPNMKNIRYSWLNHMATLRDAVELAMNTSSREYAFVGQFEGPIATTEIRIKLESVRNGAPLSNCFSRRSELRVAAAPTLVGST